jgi:hypothetical protein
VKVVALEATGEYLYESCLTHLLLDEGVCTDVEEYIEAHVEKLILLPNEDVQFLELRTGSNAVVLIVATPHLDVLAVHEIEALDLVLEHLDDGGAHLVFRQHLLKLLVVRQDIEGG